MPQEYKRRLKVVCGELAKYEVILGDHNIPNIFVVDHGLMLVDLEHYWVETEDDVEQFCRSSVDGASDSV